ncbi:response regulator [Sphingomonas crusticola]|uniref:response regulator n=1 Tax=Sphingomonas crusticola TaxID=1697973 RepID=UPI000E23AB6E|nr:response regulator [Sphingomonas crusticola]
MIPHLSERALILAPQGRDAGIAAAMLAEKGFASIVCSSVTMLLDELKAGAGFGVITEEALRDADLNALSQWIQTQPEWSDFPFILLTVRGGGLERNPAAGRYLDMLGNVTFLERPFHPTTLISLAQAARRGRQRQYDARARLEELHSLAADLERRVEERTREREQAVEQLHEAQKLETLGQLTGGVAHDFNNLLTPIIGALDLLQHKVAGNDARIDRLIGHALQSGERAKTLVQRLLGFARRQVLQTDAVDVGELLNGMRDLIVSSVGPTIELRLHCAADLPRALADPNQLELALLNLCVNARDAMPEGGVLTVACDQALVSPGEDAKLAPGLYVRLSVIDSGEGMDGPTLARAVEPFFSTKETGRGTGLGLSMVHGLAGQLNGAFTLSSSPGNGTRADLYLPITHQPRRADQARGGGRPAPQNQLMTILFVDDEELVRKGTAEMMRDLGHEVIEAAGGEEALAKLETGLEVDAVITDYKMPRMDGGELARRIRRDRPGLPILLVTGYTGVAEPVLGLPRLNKPFGLLELAEALNELGNGENEDNVVPLHGHRERRGPR